MDFRVELQKMQPIPGNMREIQKQLERCQQELNAINNALNWQIKRKEQISRRILAAARKVEEQSGKMITMESSLDTVISLYDAAEARIIGQSSSQEAQKGDIDNLSAEAKSFLENVDWENIDWQDLMKNLALILAGRWDLVLIDKLISEYRERQMQKQEEIRNWIAGIEDEATRKYLEEHMDYAKKLKETYEKSSGTARDLYDRYKDRIKIASMEEDGSYCIGDELHINYKGDIKDPRGADSVYYHESGHWIVNEEGWVSGREMSPEFQKFDQAVKKDVSSYISQIEAEQRAKYSGKYSGDQLNAKVVKETQKYLEKELGGSRTHVLNGVSDMIDAASNGKYRITYTHNKGYWDANSTRQANEAFAEMFSADFCNDTVESDYMREHFPNAYREYENLKQSAING